MKPKLLIFLALVLCGGLFVCFSARAGMPSAGVRKVVDGNTGFAVNLYGQLRTGGGNVFCSPYSISTALAMAYAGARGETATQIAQTLHFNLPDDELPPAFAAQEAEFNAVQKKGNIQLAIANSLWPQEGFPLLPDYLAICRKYYGSSVTPVDYLEHTEAARKEINDWVEARTNRKIVELIKPEMVDALTRLVLVDVIYFKGNWASPFKAYLTENEPFHVSPKMTIIAPLMQQTGDFGYAEFPDLQVLELPYAGDDLSMVVLLPRQMDGHAKLEEELTVTNMKNWTENLEIQKVQAFLPKFTATSEFLLANTLADMGMPDAFNSLADFSGMDGRKDLLISQVIHKAYVKVDEQGTEAAAATAIVMLGGMAPMRSPPIPVFRADHPFLFLIRDNQTGSILFLGRVANPTESGNP